MEDEIRKKGIVHSIANWNNSKESGVFGMIKTKFPR